MSSFNSHNCGYDMLGYDEQFSAAICYLESMKKKTCNNYNTVLWAN